MTLVSDISHVGRVNYVGIDNRAAGRLAGYLIGRFLPGASGKVAHARRRPRLSRP